MVPGQSDSPFAEAGLASSASLSLPERPSLVLSHSRPRGRLRELSSATDKIYVFELYAAGATVFQLRDVLSGRAVFSFAGNEAACSALPKGAARGRMAPMLVFAL